MEEKDCPHLIRCLIFQENVFINEKTGITFRVLYCNTGAEKFDVCKKFQTIEKSGKPVPENILPNSKLSIDEIINIMTSSLN